MKLFGYISLMSSTLPFYYAIVEQFYTGELIMAEINGIDDGSILYVGFCLLTAYKGTEIWTTQVSFFGEAQEPLIHKIAYLVLLSQVAFTINW